MWFIFPKGNPVGILIGGEIARPSTTLVVELSMDVATPGVVCSVKYGSQSVYQNIHSI